jgi:hypothetical protein
MKRVLFLSIMLVNILALGFSQTNSWAVNNVSSWIEAVNGVRNGGNDQEYTITVTGNVSVPASNENTFGSVTNITITLEGSGTLSPSANGSMLYIGNGQTIIANNITLQGRSNNNASVVIIKGGATFRMEGNARLAGNAGNGVTIEAGYSETGTFIMDGGTISGNTGNGVDIIRYSSGIFTMNGGTISGNTGNGVYLNAEGTKNFTMNGGTISNNTSHGVEISYGSLGNITFTMRDGNISDNKKSGINNHGGSFIMHGGTISNNNAQNGGGVYGSAFTMHGGTISNNNAQNGGGVFVSEFTMTGGTILNNTADLGGGVCIGDGSFTMRGNASISGNTARQNGGGVYLGTSNRTNYLRQNFTMQDDSSLSGNTANIRGGGIFISDYRGSFSMQGGLITGNTTTASGGGLYNNGGDFTKTGGIIYGDDAEQNLKNNVISGLGHVVYETENGGWRNVTAGQTMNTDSYGFWLNDGDMVTFPKGFTGTWRRNNFNNTLTVTENTIKSSSSNSLWILQRFSGDSYTFKRSNAANTLTITLRLTRGYYGNNIEISGDSGSGQDNWNGTWGRQ